MDVPLRHAGQTRKTRFVCVSDTHGASPLQGAFKLPAGDVLIHAGDLTNQGSLSELRKTVAWIEKADFEAKIVIAGNHDITLDQLFYLEHGLNFHNQLPQNPQECIDLLTASPSITYLKHEAATIKLKSSGGPHTAFKVFGSPYSPASGSWAFQYHPDLAQALWEAMPLDTDICITHTPPRFHCDEAPGRGGTGCEDLRRALWCVRPRLAVCGHVHEGRGVERVRWRLDASHGSFGEESSSLWVDPGMSNKKQSLVDASKKGASPLNNDGAAGDTRERAEVRVAPQVAESLLDANARLESKVEAALAGRSGRKETCVVNAAIMASSWPHRGRYNKPIVVDVDLPVWEDDGIHTISAESSQAA